MSELQEANGATWHFFRRSDEPDIWCAVPAERSLPRFLLSGEWQFGGHRTRPAGFRLAAAHESAGLNGFYLFHRVPDRAFVGGEMSRPF